MLSGGRRQPRKNLRTAGMSIVVKSTGSQVLLLSLIHIFAPFEFEKEHGRRYCVTLEDFEKLRYIFTWKDSDIEGNGYEWEEVMNLFVKDRFSDIRKRIKFDSEAGMFYMYCSDGDMLKEVISRFVEELKATGLKEYVEKIDFETL